MPTSHQEIYVRPSLVDEVSRQTSLPNWNPGLNASNPSCRFDPSYRSCVQKDPTPEILTPSTGP